MFAVPTVVLADGRVALVVGNSTYAHIGRLPNPDNDARDMSAALRRLGFEVTTEFDADRAELTEALRGRGVQRDRVVCCRAPRNNEKRRCLDVAKVRLVDSVALHVDVRRAGGCYCTTDTNTWN